MRFRLFIVGVVVIVFGIPAALLGLAVWGCFGLTHHAIVAIDKIGDAGVQLGRAGDTMTAAAARINGKHGTIAMLDEDLGATKSLIVHADLVARHEQQQLSKWDARGAELYANVNGSVTDLRSTITKAGATEDAATRFVDTLRAAAADKTNGLGAVLANVNGGVADVRSMAGDGRRITKATAGAMEHVEAITADGHKVADHYEKAIDTKSPWYMRVLPGWLQEAAKVAVEYEATH